MAGIPSPLQVGSPVSGRKPSVDTVPTALRAGSPATEHTKAPWHSRPPLTRKNTSGSNRLSELFPSRPSPVSPISPLMTTEASRRTSYPSPLIPAAESRRTSLSSTPPAPPSFYANTTYEPSANPFEAQGASASLQSRSGTRKLLNRLTSLRGVSTRGGSYNRINDKESDLGRRHLGGVKEDDESIGHLQGGAYAVQMDRIDSSKKMSSTVDAVEHQRDLSEAGYAAEYERLERQLGAGMSSITEKPFTYTPAPLGPGSYSRQPRGLPNTKISAFQAQDAQKEAEKTGGIVAVAEIPVDISESFSGGDFEARSMMISSTRLDKDEAQKSYFFPKDPDMPSWRPLTMGLPWLAMLVFIALALAALQEYLCRLSKKKAEEGHGLAEFKKADDLSLGAFFIWKYVPIIAFVFYGILWQMSDFEVKRLEPYYQLSQKTGATAGESLNMDYLTFMSWLVPLRALRHRQYAVIWSSLGTLIASSLVPVLQSASITVYPLKEDRISKDPKYIRIDAPWSRAVSGCLVFVAFCGGALMYAMRRRSGLLSNPQGIAGVAAMATRSHILTDFHGLDEAPLEKIHKQLRHRRYILHKSSLWQGEYIRNAKDKHHEHSADPRPLMLRLVSGVPFVAYIILVTAAVPVLTFMEATSVVTDKIPFLLTGLATIVKILWNTMNCDVRMLQPFYILSKRRAPAKTLTLDYAGTNPLFLPFIAIFNRHWLVALVAFGSVLAEVLTVCVSSITVDGTRFIPGRGGDDDKKQDAKDRHNQEQTFRSFWVSLTLSILILLYLITIAILTYMRRSHKFMPRQIGTMASVLAMIHQSKMLTRSFVDTEKLTSSQMTRHLEKQGKTYALGWFTGRDNDEHLGIDEEPVTRKYVYGEKWRSTRVLGNQIGTWEQY
ncbi:uncharacterized protein EKO05_0004979 [Ascochyta rabiei]|uniref:Uncharacterized protein n=1 Tax=Didymella rabiei TaxID=5454 RepID=A0A163KHW0_DIDRA|nr:uncharacterized protein EKO05_0004979 [Ascochyta rabiei]KZM27011.1 hypothetical protein ST47_g1829 [Ascochyta rabiei]UPX14499.1 hypothetical protein EKO05_0004979 [Ascochyta rabiei]